MATFGMRNDHAPLPQSDCQVACEDYSSKEEEFPPSEWDQSSFFGKWTFSMVNPLLDLGEKGPLKFDQLLHISDRDHARTLVKKLRDKYNSSKNIWFIPRLLVAFFRMDLFEFYLVAFYTVLEGVARVASPVLMIFLLRAIQQSAPLSEAFMWAAILSVIGFIQVFVHHVLFMLTMRMGWNWKNATTAFIHEHLIHLDTAVLNASGSGAGRLVNLISNDVQRFEFFTIFMMNTWESLLEVVAILVILCFILNVPSAFAGVSCTFIIIPLILFFARKFAQLRTSTAAQTDKRVRHISEIIDGIASVKSYAWEAPFFRMIDKLRQQETSYIKKTQTLKSINYGISFSFPALIAFITFSVFWATGGRLELPSLFAALALLQVLQFALGRAWINGIEMSSEAIASANRIESFLQLEGKYEFDDKDITKATHTTARRSQPKAETDQMKSGAANDVSLVMGRKEPNAAAHAEDTGSSTGKGSRAKDGLIDIDNLRGTEGSDQTEGLGSYRDDSDQSERQQQDPELLDESAKSRPDMHVPLPLPLPLPIPPSASMSAGVGRTAGPIEEGDEEEEEEEVEHATDSPTVLSAGASAGTGIKVGSSGAIPAVLSLARSSYFYKTSVSNADTNTSGDKTATAVGNDKGAGSKASPGEGAGATTVGSGGSGRGSGSSDEGGSKNVVSVVLQDVSLSVGRGELVMIVGPVGSGKSSLLSAALGEISALPPGASPPSDDAAAAAAALSSGFNPRSVEAGVRIAYCAQRPWILASSVRANVAMAGRLEAGDNFKDPEHVDPEAYSRAVESTLLVDDFKQWPAYDDTEVGERGISISGGQKARMSLARAVYSDADLYLLDDPLSAVDAHVGKALMAHCIYGALRARGKAVLLVTHQLQYLKFADRVLVLDRRGRQTFYGTYAQLEADTEAMQALDILKSDEQEDEQDEGEDEGEDVDADGAAVDETEDEGDYGEDEDDKEGAAAAAAHEASLNRHADPAQPRAFPASRNRGVVGIYRDPSSQLVRTPSGVLRSPGPRAPSAALTSHALQQLHHKAGDKAGKMTSGRQLGFGRSPSGASLSSLSSAGDNVKQGSKYDPTYRAKIRSLNKKISSAGGGGGGGSGGGGSASGASKSAGLEKGGDAEGEAEAEAEEKDKDGECGGDEETALEKQRRKVVQVEDQQQGQISLGVYWRYICSGGRVRGVLALLVIFLSQGVLMMATYWLRWWASEQFGPQSRPLYIGVFAALVVASIAIAFYRSFGWFQFTLIAASNLHRSCLWAVLHSPLRFFVSNPTGRILNRFALDQNLTDERLPMTFFLFLETAIYCLSGVLLVCITIPWLLLLLPPLMWMFHYVRHRYVLSSREIKRIEAVTRSPIYSDFSATLDGLVTLRAYKMQRKVIKMFQNEIDDNARAYFSFVLASRWIGFRLDLQTAIILMFVTMIAVVLRDSIDVGLLGFTLVYVLALSGLFQWAVRQSAEVEVQMTSVERIHSYAHLPPEEGYSGSMEEALGQTQEQQHGGAGRQRRSSSAASSGDVEMAGVGAGGSEAATKAGAPQPSVGGGHVELKDLTVTYRPDLDPVLRNVTLDFPAGHKVGICGRTGSGKSSTLLALLRLNIISSGDILVDGSSLLSMDLQTARGIVSIIPQDPHLFSGTIRFNLDPFSAHSDEDIWAALRDAHIHRYVSEEPLGLSAVVEEGGQNFSVGQRQLLSLARAILRRSKVVLMDEVTASIDFLTDRLIQETIRTSPALRDATIITVAHRLRTIADSDLIVVVHAGKVVEQGPPVQLLQQESSHFRVLAEESNEFEEIFRIASAAERGGDNDDDTAAAGGGSGSGGAGGGEGSTAAECS